VAADVKRTEGEPHDRLTRLCDAMLDTLAAHPEVGDEKVIIFLQDGGRGGLVLHGYDEDTDAMVDLLIHLKAIFEANGKTLLVAPLGQG
jgi:hypothetical protein